MDKEESFNLTLLFSIIKKKLILILAISITLTLISGAINYLVLKPIYESTATVVVGNAPNQKVTPDQVQMYQNLVTTYSKLVTSRVVTDFASKKLNGRISAALLSSRLKVSSPEDTSILQISIQDGNPQFAADEVNAVVEGLVDQIPSVVPWGYIQTIDKALVSPKPILPRKALNTLVTLFLSLIFSISTILIFESMKKNINNKNDVEKYLKIPSIGIIPKIKSKEIRGNPLCFIDKVGSNVYKNFICLRTNLLSLCLNSNLKTVLVTSCLQDEGKSILAYNLAESIAKTGKKVLIMDCNFSNPTLHKILNISNDFGVLNLLHEDASISSVVVNVSKYIDGLVCGEFSEDSAKSKVSRNIEQIIKELECCYDYIIIDSATILTMTEEHLLASKSAGVALVISSGQISIDMCNKAKEILGNINANVLGVILNKVVDRNELIINSKDSRKFKRDMKKQKFNINKNKQINLHQ